MKIGNLVFDEEVKMDILDLYGKTIDGEGFIVEKENMKQKVLTPKGEEIQINEWAGIIKGSEAFVKLDAFSLIELAKKIDETS